MFKISRIAVNYQKVKRNTKTEKESYKALSISR